MADTVEMVVVDGIRYRPEDAPKATPKKATPPAKNKARQPAAGGDAGDSGTVSTK
jgi:hypothetical protein